MCIFLTFKAQLWQTKYLFLLTFQTIWRWYFNLTYNRVAPTGVNLLVIATCNMLWGFYVVEKLNDWGGTTTDNTHTHTSSARPVSIATANKQIKCQSSWFSLHVLDIASVNPCVWNFWRITNNIAEEVWLPDLWLHAEIKPHEPSCSIYYVGTLECTCVFAWHRHTKGRS